MNILHIASIDNDPFSGVPCMVPKMIIAENREISRRIGMDIRLASGPLKDTVRFLNIRNKEISRLKGIQIEMKWENGNSLSDLPEPADNPDLVVFHEVYYPGFLLIAKELRERGIPYIIVPHGCLTSEAQHIKSYKKLPANILLFNRYIFGAVCLRFLSENEKKNTLKKFRVKNFTLGAGIGSTGEINHSFFPEGRKGIRYTYIGRIDRYIKGLDLLLEAVHDKADFLGVNSCCFDLYGPDVNGSKKALRQTIKELEIDSLVKIHTSVSDEEKDRILKNTDVFVLSSRSEGLPLGVLEALSYGIPCLVSSGSGLSDIVNEYNAGCEENGLSELIKKSVDESGELEIKSLNALKLIRKKFSEEINTEKLMKIYRNIICSGHKERSCN